MHQSRRTKRKLFFIAMTIVYHRDGEGLSPRWKWFLIAKKKVIARIARRISIASERIVRYGCIARLAGDDAEHSQYHPCGNHVADVAKDDEEMEGRMYVGYLLEAIEYGAYDIGYPFAYHP